jgi:hypothetical protein
MDNDDSSWLIGGGNYCAWGPDYECYVGGRPICCFDENDEACPIGEVPPGCDLLSEEEEREVDDADADADVDNDYAVDGSDYCTWAPDYDCYPTYGWAACCFDENTPCPDAIPECENTSPSSIESYTESEEDQNEDGVEDDEAGNDE